MNINCNYKPFTKYALLICLAFLGSTNQIYSQTIFNMDSSVKDESLSRKSRVTETRKQPPANIQFHKSMNVTGKVTKIITESSIIMKYNGRDLLVKFKGKEASNIKAGDNVSVTCVPYRENPNGVIISTGEKIEKLNDEVSSSTNSEATQEFESLPEENTIRNSSEGAVKVKRTLTSFKMNKTCTISAEITELVSDKDIMIRYEGREILVKFRGREVSDFEVGDRVFVTCTPYRENPNGVIMANGSKIEKED